MHSVAWVHLPAKQDIIIIIINVELSELNQSILLKVCNTFVYKCINITAGVFIFTLCNAQQRSHHFNVILFAFYMHSKNSVQCCVLIWSNFSFTCILSCCFWVKEISIKLTHFVGQKISSGLTFSVLIWFNCILFAGV